MFLSSQTLEINLNFRVQVWQKLQVFRVRADKNTKSLLFDLIAFFLLTCCFFEFGKTTDFFRVYVRFGSSCSKCGFVVFYREFTKLIIFCTGSKCRRYGGAQGHRTLLLTACAPHFGLLRMLFWSIT